MAKGPYAVCNVHGSEVIKGLPKARMVRAAMPLTKKQRFEVGCPVCAKERKEEK